MKIKVRQKDKWTDSFKMYNYSLRHATLNIFEIKIEW